MEESTDVLFLGRAVEGRTAKISHPASWRSLPLLSPVLTFVGNKTPTSAVFPCVTHLSEMLVELFMAPLEFLGSAQVWPIFWIAQAISQVIFAAKPLDVTRLFLELKTPEGSCSEFLHLFPLFPTFFLLVLGRTSGTA